MKALITFLITLFFAPLPARDMEKEQAFLHKKMIPLAEEFVKRNELPSTSFRTNDMKYRVVFFTAGRKGCIADLSLKNGYAFGFHSEGTNSEVWSFSSGEKRYYNLVGAPTEKIEAVKSLLSQNKLNDKTALNLARKFFLLQGHKEENFHPPEIRQSAWVGAEGETDTKGFLPYYEVEWYRKDVKPQDRLKGVVGFPYIKIEISGINSNLISYDKGFMPIGRDF